MTWPVIASRRKPRIRQGAHNAIPRVERATERVAEKNDRSSWENIRNIVRDGAASRQYNRITAGRIHDCERGPLYISPGRDVADLGTIEIGLM